MEEVAHSSRSIAHATSSSHLHNHDEWLWWGYEVSLVISFRYIQLVKTSPKISTVLLHGSSFVAAVIVSYRLLSHIGYRFAFDRQSPVVREIPKMRLAIYSASANSRTNSIHRGGAMATHQ